MDPQAAVDAHGRVRLWRYPVAAKGAVPRDSYAHAAPGGSIAWSAAGTRLVSPITKEPMAARARVSVKGHSRKDPSKPLNRVEEWRPTLVVD